MNDYFPNFDFDSWLHELTTVLVQLHDNNTFDNSENNAKNNKIYIQVCKEDFFNQIHYSYDEFSLPNTDLYLEAIKALNRFMKFLTVSYDRLTLKDLLLELLVLSFPDTKSQTLVVSNILKGKTFSMKYKGYPDGVIFSSKTVDKVRTFAQKLQIKLVDVD